jgi:hypothetical protein
VYYYCEDDGTTSWELPTEPDRWCKKCKVAFGTARCPQKHASFLYTAVPPTSQGGMAAQRPIDVEEAVQWQESNSAVAGVELRGGERSHDEDVGWSGESHGPYGGAKSGTEGNRDQGHAADADAGRGDAGYDPVAAPARAVLGYDTTGDGRPDAFDTNQARDKASHL